MVTLTPDVTHVQGERDKVEGAKDAHNFYEEDSHPLTYPWPHVSHTVHVTAGGWRNAGPS